MAKVSAGCNKQNARRSKANEGKYSAQFATVKARKERHVAAMHAPARRVMVDEWRLGEGWHTVADVKSGSRRQAIREYFGGECPNGYRVQSA